MRKADQDAIGSRAADRGGKVRINGARAAKASRLVHAGDVVTATPTGRLFVVRVVGAAETRGPASLARTLYEDLIPQETPSPSRVKAASPRGPRPTKRDRRRLDALRTHPL